MAATQQNLLQGSYAQQSRQAPTSESSTFIARDEMNLAEFPLTVLSTRVNNSVKTLEFKDTIRGKNGEMVEREWVITGADKFGLPTSTDDDVILGLICLTMMQGFRERKVFFSRYELLKILQWSTEGRSYSRLSKSLDRLSGVRIRATNAFFDNSSKGFQTCNFGVIDAYEICDTRGSKDKSYFIWSEILFDSFKSGFIKKLDLDLYFSLRSAVSRRLYRYLDKHFYYRSVVEKPILTLAFEKLGLSRSYQYVSSIKQQLEPAAEELVERGFLEGFEFEGRGATTIVRFHHNPHFCSRKPQLVQSPGKVAPTTFQSAASVSDYPSEPDTSLIDSREQGSQRNAEPIDLRKRRLASRLEKNGLTPLQAKRLLNSKSPQELETTEKVITDFESLQAAGGTKGFSNPVGFLYRAVQNSESFSVPRLEQRRPSVKSAPPPIQDPLRAGYDRFVQDQIAAAFGALSAEQLLSMRKGIEEKLSCLKGILDKSRFEEAVQGCIREELRKGLPNFERWRKAQEASAF
jgi:hypothetical protein